MRVRTLASVVCLVATASVASSAPTKGVSAQLYDRIHHFLVVAQATYAGDSCNLKVAPRVASILNTTTDTHGWVLHDDAAKEIIVSFKGTGSQKNLDTDTNYTLAGLASEPACVGCQVHGGYYLAWLSVRDRVDELVKAAVAKYPSYGLVITGHSLGASLASLAANHLVQRYSNVTAFTYGEPRSGNKAYADFMDAAFNTSSIATTRYFRVTHEDDGIVPLPTLADGYYHQALEFWVRDPPSPSNIYVCGGETQDCCAGRGGQGINDAHVSYFGISSSTCPK